MGRYTEIQSEIAQVDIQNSDFYEDNTLTKADVIENDLRKKYKCITTVKDKQGNLYEILVYIKTDMQVTFLFLYNEYISYYENINNACDKIDKFI